jgi:hypothetical protein
LPLVAPARLQKRSIPVTGIPNEEADRWPLVLQTQSEVAAIVGSGVVEPAGASTGAELPLFGDERRGWFPEGAESDRTREEVDVDAADEVGNSM